jgi:hypothetical protein
MARDERGLDPYVGKLWDAASGGPFESVSTVGLRIWDFRVEDLAGAKGERECWPIDVGKLWVPMVDAATGGRSMGKSINGARSHFFLLNKDSA